MNKMILFVYVKDHNVNVIHVHQFLINLVLLFLINFLFLYDIVFLIFVYVVYDNFQLFLIDNQVFAVDYQEIVFHLNMIDLLFQLNIFLIVLYDLLMIENRKLIEMNHIHVLTVLFVHDIDHEIILILFLDLNLIK